MKLTILGNNGPYPRTKADACSGYLLSSADCSTHILLDCGTGCLAALRRYIPMTALSAVFLSHLHYDHMSDMLPMQYALQFSGRRDPLPVFAPEQPTVIYGLLSSPYTTVSTIRDRQIGCMNVEIMPVRHPVPSYAIRVTCDGKRFVYTGDTNTVDGLKEFCTGADALLADAGFLEKDYSPAKPHLSARLCGELAVASGAKRLLLTHLSPNSSSRALLEEARAVNPTAELTKRFLSYEI